MKKITAIVLVFIFIITIFSGCGQKTPTVDELPSLGERYLTELDYEKAIVAFNKVIEIEPKNIDAHKELVRIYHILIEEEKLNTHLSILREVFWKQEMVSASSGL